jgi:Protein of unknown function (DUF707)
MSEQKPSRRVLVIVRAGDDSLHVEWLQGAPPETRNWDLHLSYFGDRSNPFPDRPADVTLSFEKGTKAIGTVNCLDKLDTRLAGYDWIWLPDDDLRIDLPTLNRFFEIVAQYELELAQPALGAGSHASYDITLQRPHLRLRYVSFVEIMAACFSQRALAICRPHLGATVSSWGPNHLFPKLLGRPQRQIAIVDETPCVHVRPVGRGPNLALARSLGIDPHAELASFMKMHALSRRYETFAAIDRRGELITALDEIEREKAIPASLGIS